MGRAIEQDNRLDDHERRIKELEGVIAELSYNLVNTKQTKNVDINDELSKHEKAIREENMETEAKKKTTKKKVLAVD